MTDKHRQVCLVELQELNKQRTDGSPECGCSAIRIDDRYVLTVGSLLLPILAQSRSVSKGILGENKPKLKLKSILKQNFHGSDEFRDIKCHLTFEKNFDTLASGNTEIEVLPTKGYDPDIQEAESLKSASNNFSKWTKAQGIIECLWRADNFSNTLRKTFPSYAAWKLNYENADNTEDRTNSNSRNSKNKSSNNSSNEPSPFDPDDLDQILSFFMLIRIEGSSIGHEETLREIVHPLKVDVGENVSIQGTPFGSLSPSVFLNSVSAGALCNKAGPEAELLLTDARCLPGCEGGALYYGTHHDERLLGMIVSPMCWKSTEWVGLSIACSLAEIVRSLQGHLQGHSNKLDEEWSLVENMKNFITFSDHVASQSSMKNLGGIYKNVVLIQTEGTWGSGVLIDRRRGLIITCSHVVKTAASVRVRFDHPSSHWLRAGVVYSNPDMVAYDIALLQCHGWSEAYSSQHPGVSVSAASQGIGAYVIGHALFGKEHRLPPSVTRGVLATVVRHQRTPVLLQSTCAVHSGASGGPLVDENGRILGIAVCNAKDTVSGSSFPHVNLSVPMATIWPLIQEYIDTQDPSCFAKLRVEDETVQRFWQLKRERPVIAEAKL